jgi:hypothetical protein
MNPEPHLIPISQEDAPAIGMASETANLNTVYGHRASTNRLECIMTIPGTLIPVTPRVDEDTLALLLAVRTETAELDYKVSIDLDSAEGKAEFAKDVAAMSSRGGYLVVGVADDGTPVGVGDENLQVFDETSLRNKISKWLPDGFQIMSRVHTWDNELKVVLIFIAPHPDGLVVMKEGAQYAGTPGSNRHVFRKGDVFTRHGTSSECIQQHDMKVAVQRLVDDQREIWRQEMHSMFLPLLETSRQGNAVAQGPMTAFGWQLSLDVFQSASTELIRQKDYAPLRFLLLSTPKSVGSALVDDQPVLAVGEILDRLATVSATAAILDDSVIFYLALDALAKAYFEGFDRNSIPRTDLKVRPSELWLEILKRLYALGGLLVRLERWGDIRRITLQATSIGAEPYVDSNWFRHGLTAAARANLLRSLDDQGNERELALLGFATDTVSKVPAMLPDLNSGDEKILSSMCQFDLLVALVAIQAANSTSTAHYYPNFAHFDGQRIVPILESLIDDSSMRADLGFSSEEGLRTAIGAVLNVANSERMRFRQFPQWLSSRIQQWLQVTAI